MIRSQYTVTDEIQDVSFGGPHVVLLGAGASVAATPNGDEQGRKLPLMSNFIETVGLGPILDGAGITYKNSDNFEVLYSNLASDPNRGETLQRLEEQVANYFGALRLPPEPNVYDFLVLSLRRKDLIATFNWDPFLYQACYRNRHVGDLPSVAYLHGNVATGYCLEHRRKGPPNAQCSICGTYFKPSRLIYPVIKKNYEADTFIAAEWTGLKKYLSRAFQFTIFGYGAPSSDISAFKLMKEAWGKVEDRSLEQIEIIDIRDPDELTEIWSPFIHTHHHEIHSSFQTSSLARHPRRTCEAAWQQYMECQFLEDNPMPAGASREELATWIAKLAHVESAGKN